jgi:hypothetical protein
VPATIGQALRRPASVPAQGPVAAQVGAYVKALKRASAERPPNFDALAALALSLAGTIDSGGSGGAIIGLAAIAKELRATLDDLAPGDDDDAALDFLAKIARVAAVGHTADAKPGNARRRRS